MKRKKRIVKFEDLYLNYHNECLRNGDEPMSIDQVWDALEQAGLKQIESPSAKLIQEANHE